MTTPEAMPPIEAWAKVRAVDPDAESPVCQHCPDRAVLAFRAEYAMTGIALERGELPDPERAELGTMDMVVDAYACLRHGGMVAFGAALRMLQGPVGGV